MSDKTYWDSKQLLDFCLASWRELGGIVEERKGPGTAYYKLCHVGYSTDRACTVIDLTRDGKGFDHFSNVRVSDLREWNTAFNAVADAFDAYIPSERGYQETGRANRIECTILQVPDWRPKVSHYLELCRDYWIRVGKKSK